MTRVNLERDNFAWYNAAAAVSGARYADVHEATLGELCRLPASAKKAEVVFYSASGEQQVISMYKRTGKAYWKQVDLRVE